MPLPLAPIAAVALRYGAVALATYATTRQWQRYQTRQETEDALDSISEGLAANRPRDRQQVNASFRFRRTVRMGRGGPGIEIDVTGLGRIKFKRV